uniref:RNase III domain-containing protein n=1 Tax=Meloidogyne hapla TaxID=6305 RepID=A0A1I8BKH0_MELHA
MSSIQNKDKKYLDSMNNFTFDNCEGTSSSFNQINPKINEDKLANFYLMRNYVIENIEPIATDDDRKNIIEFTQGMTEVIIGNIFVDNTVDNQMSNWQKLLHKLQTQNMSPCVLGSVTGKFIFKLIIK